MFMKSEDNCYLKLGLLIQFCMHLKLTTLNLIMFKSRDRTDLGTDSGPPPIQCGPYRGWSTFVDGAVSAMNLKPLL